MKEANHPVVGMINQRLLEAREREGLSQTAWHDRLNKAGYTVSLGSVRNYEEVISTPGSPPRMPPADYIARVAEAFRLQADWLLFGHEPMKADEMTNKEVEDLEFAKGLFGEETRTVLRSVPWLQDLEVRIPFLRLLHQCRQAAPARSDGDQDGIHALLADLFKLPFDLPGAKTWIAQPEVLTPRERNLVIMHLTSLVQLLFVPFRKADASFLWSRTLRGKEVSQRKAVEEGGTETGE